MHGFECEGKTYEFEGDWLQMEFGRVLNVFDEELGVWVYYKKCSKVMRKYLVDEQTAGCGKCLKQYKGLEYTF